MSSKKSSTSWQDAASDWLISIIVAVALAFCIRTFLVEPYMVEGSSMYPTLKHHERLIVDKLSYFITDPKKGEIVVFRYPKDETRDFIKRVIAVGGDTIEMENGKVFKAELYPEVAPNTVNNFVSLVKKGFYDGLIFHRVIRGFMIQGGDPEGTGFPD